jgi:hypothetical protein
MGIAHGSIQAAASWPKLNGLINVLDGAGTHPGLSLIVARAFAATTEEKTSTISYKFKSEETTAVGSCVSLLKPRRGYLSAQPKRRPRAGNRACGIGRLDADGVSVWYAFRTQVGHSGTSE